MIVCDACLYDQDSLLGGRSVMEDSKHTGGSTADIEHKRCCFLTLCNAIFGHDTGRRQRDVQTDSG